MKNRPHGFLLLELLVVLAAMSLLTVVGMGALHGLIDQFLRGEARQLELGELAGLGQQVQRVMDQRLDHRFLAESALETSGVATADGFVLQHLSVRTLAVSGNPLYWELARADGKWRVTETFMDQPYAPPMEKILKYGGRIVILEGDGTAPSSFRVQQWTFPDAASATGKEGFAILRFW